MTFKEAMSEYARLAADLSQKFIVGQPVAYLRVLADGTVKLLWGALTENEDTTYDYYPISMGTYSFTSNGRNYAGDKFRQIFTLDEMRQLGYELPVEILQRDIDWIPSRDNIPHMWPVRVWENEQVVMHYLFWDASNDKVYDYMGTRYSKSWDNVMPVSLSEAYTCWGGKEMFEHSKSKIQAKL
jgi:hypothetical protein